MAPAPVYVPTATVIELETPSKKAAASLEQMSLKTPTKPISNGNLLEKFSAAATEEEDEVEAVIENQPLEEWRLRFVGDVDIEEKDEPLLKESQRRFVLFPIQYNEVRSLVHRPFVRC
jgi:ribonucleoside-diphosphate reductase subunit M2